MRSKEITHSKYYAKTLQCLEEDKKWGNGVYKYKGQFLSKSHVLPLKDDKNTLENRIASLYKFVRLDCKKCLGDRLSGLHQYAHHLTSSQQLCMKFFSELIDENRRVTNQMVRFIKDALSIDISVGAECGFEYQEKKEPYLFDVDKDGNIINGYEGTSFDFHIQDGETEIYFEIKFTEDGFKKENDDKRHLVKVEKYLENAPDFLRIIVPTPHEFLNQYQIYRNIIRVKDNNKFVVFITDGNNPATNKDREIMEALALPQNVKFTTWQDLIPYYPFELPYQLKAIQNYK